ncbi:MAG TPA: CarD family transcriptional regulator, partial [Candidatus Goldiibacteriota bacterium]|nr:CarD family transcriptional regulator [Candidatus Goldiibacteriota bacterium]
SLREVLAKTAAFSCARVHEHPVKGGINIRTKPNPAFGRDIKKFFDYARELADEGYRILLISDNEAEERHIKGLIESHEKESGFTLSASMTHVSAESDGGCALPGLKLAVVSNREIFERYRGAQAARKGKRTSRPVKHISELKEKDFVVHREHGIGIFEGIKAIEASGQRSDFVLLRYAGDDKLYIPVYRIDAIDRYIGSEKEPQLSKLGTGAWHRTREQVKNELKAAAAELLEIYARRQETPGIRFSADDRLQEEFEEAFIYEETPDQERAIEDVKRDMESARQMDRLICGDAGFGKTEVALRAAFKAVNSGRQVFMLSTTTLLCQQHFNTFRQRMADYPVRVEMISRLVTASRRKKTEEDAAAGKVDILIGTQAALNERTAFKSLGLVIVDEEQHLGAKAKEYLR